MTTVNDWVWILIGYSMGRKGIHAPWRWHMQYNTIAITSATAIWKHWEHTTELLINYNNSFNRVETAWSWLKYITTWFGGNIIPIKLPLTLRAQRNLNVISWVYYWSRCETVLLSGERSHSLHTICHATVHSSYVEPSPTCHHTDK